MNLKKFFAAIVFATLISLSNCYAAETIASTPPDSDSWMLALVKENSDYYLVAYNNQMNNGALIPYDSKFYNFYLNESPVIFTMYIPGDQRDADANLGEWDEDFHLLPVYALFNYSNGRVNLESYLSSGKGLKPSHYQGRIQSPYHIKLATIFLTRMPELHRAVESKGITLP